MRIGGLLKLSLLDYPGNVSCIVFTQGCNYNCPFCHNSSLITNNDGNVKEEEIFEYLNKRKNIIDAVSISGGEPLIQEDIIEFIKKIKELGYKVKIDTNGSKPEVLKKLIDNKLIDYVAMDIKNTLLKYEKTTGVKLNNIIESIKVIENSNIDYEFRTTIIKELHNIDDIKEILKLINKKTKYYIQNFKRNDQVLNKNLNGFSTIELIDMKKILEKEHQNIEFRDV